MQRSNAGRTVTGHLVQTEDRTWVEITPKDIEAARKEAAKVSKARDHAHEFAIRTDFILEAYTGRDRIFEVDGETLDAGQFTNLYRARFSPRRRPTTVYTEINQLLIDSGHRLKAKAARTYLGRDENGQGHYPHTLET